MVKSDWLEEVYQMKVVLKCVRISNGALFVMISGVLLMQVSFASNLATQESVNDCN